MSIQIAKLFARIGLKTDAAKAAQFQSKMEGVKTAIKLAAVSAGAFSLAVKKITDESFRAAAAFKQFEAETGASAQELQKWQSVADQTNDSSQALTESIKALASNREKIKLGQGNISGYQLLGIDPLQDPFDIMEELREKTEELPQAMKKNILSQMGVSNQLIQVLELSNDEFDKMASRAFILPRSAIETIDRARGSMRTLGGAITYLKGLITAGLAPQIEKTIDSIVTWIKLNEEGIVKAFKEVFRWITRFSTAIVRSGIMINRIVRNTIGWKAAIVGLVAVMALLNASIIASPIGLLIAGLVLLIAILDDLYVYSTGKGKSLFGVMMEAFPEFEEKLLWFVGKLKETASLIKSLFKGDQTGIDEMVKKLGAFGVGVVALFQLIKINFDIMFAYVKGFLKPFQFLIDTLQVLWGAFQGDIGIGEAFGQIKEAFKTRAGESFTDLTDLGARSEERLKNIYNSFKVSMDISTTADAAETARIVGERLQRGLNSASSQRARDE